jgi:dolichol-phosphate mannosyltransferase
MSGSGSERTLVVVPTYNERQNLGAFLGALREAAPRAHVLVVDDGSPDGTGALADEFAATDANVHVMHRAQKLGLGRAYVAGFEWGLAGPYDWFVEMDADLSHDPTHLAAFFAAFEAGADVVVGSRNIAGGSVVGWGPVRTLLSKGGSLYSRMVLGVRTRDLTTGYKAYTRRVLEVLDVRSLTSNGYSFQIETTFRALQAGFCVVEVPIVFVDRVRGASKMNRRILAEAVVVVWRLRLQSRRTGER